MDRETIEIYRDKAGSPVVAYENREETWMHTDKLRDMNKVFQAES